MLLYLLEGELCLDVHNSVTPLHAHEMLVLPYRSTYRTFCAGEGFTAVYVSVLDELTAEHRGEAAIFPGTPAARSLVSLIREEVRRPGPGSAAMRQHLGEGLAILALRLLNGSMVFAPDAPVTAETWAQTVRQYIEEACYSSQPLQASLADIPLSYQQLARHFHAVYGQTPKQYQLYCRVKEAGRLLLSTRLSVTTIAQELGFASSQHFSLVFKRHTGVSPSRFKDIQPGVASPENLA